MHSSATDACGDAEIIVYIRLLLLNHDKGSAMAISVFSTLQLNKCSCTYTIVYTVMNITVGNRPKSEQNGSTAAQADCLPV
jgi:hypothetical protein